MKDFNFIKNTDTLVSSSLTKGQLEKAKKYNIKRVLKFRYTFSLPNYIIDAAKKNGFSKHVILGYTTYKSSIWGFYK